VAARERAAEFHVVDVFAERAYAGNPLAVVVGDEGIDEATMQLIAAEANFSETTFVAGAARPDGAWRVRIFTPAREIDFAGHPILGTAAVIRDRLAPGPGPVRLRLRVGEVPVTFEPDGKGAELAWFRAPEVSLGRTCDPGRMAHALGLAARDLEARTPVRMAGAGTAAMIVPLRGLAELERAHLDLGAYAPLAREGFPPLVYLFCAEARAAGNDLSARFFFEAHGVREDPATGNGAAFLGAYLLEHGLLGPGPLDLRIEQGHVVRRPSLVRLRARSSPGGCEIEVGGGVIATVRGNLAAQPTVPRPSRAQ
jgi:trans-2,3-dihydro-3-hydroxyanthranilate isomerase